MPHSKQLTRSETGAGLRQSSLSSATYATSASPHNRRASRLDDSNANTAVDTPDLEISALSANSSSERSQFQSTDQPNQTQRPHKRTAIDITVAIPTYNGADRLPLVLDRLRSQTHLDGINWEIIVCDNGSTDDTATVVKQYQKDWQTHWPEGVALHYRFAAEQGAAFARQRAVEAAEGELIAFLDDDNLPASDWLYQAISFARTYPEAGAFGSQIHGQFESELPAELENIKCFLAIIERGNEPHLYEPANKILPPAAGLVVRKSAWLSSVPERLFLNNKGKEAGLASEDLEAMLYIQKAGHDIWYNPAMIVHHDIPDGRLRKDYLLTLFRCVGLSRFHIRLLGLKKWKRPAAIPAYIANDICKLALHRIRHGARQQLSTTEACKRTLLTSSATSPFFLLKKVYKDAVQNREDSKHSDRQQQLAQIAQAFEQDQFMLYQQPVIDVGHNLTKSSLGQKELLIRLRTQRYQCVLPHDFLPTAKRYQLMRTLDRWVIRNLIEHVAQQMRSGELNIPASQRTPLYSINLSEQSVGDIKLARFVANKLSQAKLPAHWFCFEIDSSAAISSPQAASTLASDLHQIGCQVTLDNIVVSREATEQLQHLPIDYIKLDSAFLTSAAPGQQRRTLSRKSEKQVIKTWMHIQSMAAAGKVEAIAKGIESEAQLDTVQRQGIRYAQGYKMARPQPLQ